MGDMKARNPLWRSKAKDDTTNHYGLILEKWIRKEEYKGAKHNRKTFRTISVVDLSLYKN